MNTVMNYIFTYPRIPFFAKGSFKLLNIQADKVMIGLLVLQWFIATFITSILYDTYYYGFFGGALIVIPILILYPFLKGDNFYRYFIAIALMLFSVIFIQQYLGRIEMHFHVFITMAILTLYKDIFPLLAAALTTTIHHIVFNYLQLYEVSLFDMPVMVFNYGCGFDIVLLHAIFVVSEFLVLGYLIRLQREHNIDLNIARNKVFELNKELKHTSLHDSLTGLPNRLYLNEQIEKVKHYADENSKKFAIIFLDLDHFKNINDTLGHDIGDALLQTVANILRNGVNKNDLITRIGGDEFIIVISDFDSDDELLPIITNLLREFRKELLIKGYSLRLSASIGISIFPDDSSSIRELMKYADIAMYNAKADGRDNFSFFTQSLNTKIHNEVDIINDMQRAFYDNEFKLYYQPKVDAKSKKIVGAEALLRWIHHEKGLIGPDVFIPISESTGFMLSLGKFVIQESSLAIRRFSDLGYNGLKVSINISTRQFQNTDLYQDLKEELSKNDVDPKQLGIEITESIMMQHIKKTLTTLQEIKNLGVSIYIDDFGTGYSSLSYLKKFPIDTLKIDKSFVDDISEVGNNDEILLNTILAMGKSLGLDVVAEGVEHEYQYSYLKEHGCEIIQGYYFAKPMPEEEFIKLLHEEHL
ncbi:diguanylate cyclase/phosphodiesterase (GGDEF & EAL domains) [Sulfurimonas gotlandica GD1]|uniref:Diguanylate cyclase/phosphodiesterase (GGDEF & EAL domains) n=1 Tax=Sulfurimonas gotlandica (strain DSM 19862 / JCM 16533 / GD1) TaxID=929558 RepID=B6BJN9_SULGG|nr:EAL domain-containing protein [Sulfurimonas gotlandica]EDZ62640.1 sensory box sensor/ggdef/eal domain protein [Sulfurimonas gotlandica GD1]EHP31285.1 diguanylate cyclase/phosphodiesterase (GGDEF & EAL domains) [Sulfurimonas gotlandica GD1]